VIGCVCAAQETLNHMGDEEQNLLPKLKQVLSKEELLQLGDSLERARAMAPTRPHPSAPDKGLAGHAGTCVAHLVASRLPQQAVWSV